MPASTRLVRRMQTLRLRERVHWQAAARMPGTEEVMAATMEGIRPVSMTCFR